MGEHRHITVMLLVDSTGIAAKLDAEEWRDLVGAYRRRLGHRRGNGRQGRTTSSATG
jgi:hypothetical protein